MRFALLTLVIAATVPAVAVAQRPTLPVLPASHGTPDPALTTRWRIDPAHSSVHFRIKHLIGTVNGEFGQWGGSLQTNGLTWTRGAADISIATATIATGNRLRDADLRSARFFDAAHYPSITFTTTGMIVTGTEIELGGLLTIRGQTRAIVLRGTYNGVALDAEGRQRVGFEAEGRINRRAFGLQYNEAVDGLAVVGDEVQVRVDIEAIALP